MPGRKRAKTASAVPSKKQRKELAANISLDDLSTLAKELSQLRDECKHSADDFKQLCEETNEMVRACATAVQAEIEVLRGITKTAAPCIESSNATQSAVHVEDLAEVPQSGALVLRRFADYELLKCLSKRVFHVKRGGHQSVIKRFCGREEHRAFLRELDVLLRIRHPCVIAATAYFVDGDSWNVEMPYYGRGSLANWLLLQPRSLEEKRGMFLQVVQGLAKLHDVPIAHGDLLLTNVVVAGPGRAVLIDFECSAVVDPPSAVQRAVTARRQSSQGYLAPELQRDGALPPTPAADVWALGVMLFKAFTSHSMEVIVEGSDVRWDHRFDADSNWHLIDLLEKVFKVDPTERPTVFDLCAHSFFTFSITDELKAEGLLRDRGRSISTLCSVLKDHKAQGRTWSLSVRRAHVREDVLREFGQATPQTLYRPLNVTFATEKGVDEGGLTTDMFVSFFKALATDTAGNTLFECREPQGAASILPTPSVTAPKTGWSKVAALPKKAKADYATVGRVLARCLMDRRVVPCVFAPSFYKFLCEGLTTLTVRDLQGFDSDLSHQLFDSVAGAADVSAWDLDFSSAPPTPVDVPHSEGIDWLTAVDNDNRDEYLQRRLHAVLLHGRVEALEVTKNAFWEALPDQVAATLHGVSFIDLKFLLSGQERVAPSDIIALVTWEKYRNEKERQKQEEALTDVLAMWHSSSPRLVRHFLEFVTGSPALPATNGIKIELVSNESSRLPVAHTCFNLLELPAYSSSQVMAAKLELSFEHALGGAFTLR